MIQLKQLFNEEIAKARIAAQLFEIEVERLSGREVQKK